MEKLPPYVYARPKRSAYIWRPYTPGKPRREYRLCHIDATLPEVYQAWLSLQGSEPKTFTLKWLLTEYEDSKVFADLPPNTQKQYRSRHRVICEFPMKNGDPFGIVFLHVITPGWITKFMELVQSGGGGSPSRANNFRSAILTAWDWAVSRDLIIIDNPAKKTKRYKNKVSKRFVTVDEYDLFYKLACESRFAWLPSFITIAYICRLRMSEVINLKHEHCLEVGLKCVRVKGSDTNIVRWSPKLRDAVMHGGEWLIYRRDGSQLSNDRVSRCWNEVMDDPAYNLPKFTPHALKARGISNTDIKYRRASAGHRSEANVMIYDRVIDVVDPVE